MKRLSSSLAAILMVGWIAGGVVAEEKKPETKSEAKEQGKPSKSEAKREEIDAMAKESLDRVLKESEGAKGLYDRAAGYAVFDNMKFTFVLSGGGGVGVAVDKDSGKRTYMKMGTAGVALGLGGQKYQIVFLFESEDRLTSFVEKGWQADANASAVAGNKGVNAGATFHDGVAFYVLTEAGLMLSADISGTKYWKHDKLNG